LHILAIYLHYPTHRATTPQFLRSRASWFVQLGIFLRPFAFYRSEFANLCVPWCDPDPGSRQRKARIRPGISSGSFPGVTHPAWQNRIQCRHKFAELPGSSLRVPVAPMIMN